MNSRQWRENGYKTIFRNSRIYLYRPSVGVVIHIAINKGDWMHYNNVNCSPWIIEPKGIDGLPVCLQDDLRKTVKACYCDQGVNTCDFCAGIRKA